MRYILILLGLMIAGVANAIDCQKLPDCESLGYASEDDPSCAPDGYVYCPFDENYKKCVNYDCAKLGFTESDKTSWCKNITTCRGNEKYTLCVKATCEIGDVYYSDGSCGLVEDFNGSKTPVGVVYYVSDGGRHGKVINLHDLGRSSKTAKFNPQKPYDTTYTLFEWGVYGTNISDLTNWTCSGNTDYLTVAKTGNHEDAFWSAGKSYTETIAKAQSSNLQYAAPATLAFYPPDVPEDDPKVGKGKWYLPTLGELMDLYGYNYTSGLSNCSSSTDGATGMTKTTVNATLQALKDKSAGNAETLTNNYYWSSSEYNSTNSWLLTMDNGNRNYPSKENYIYVRASLAF